MCCRSAVLLTPPNPDSLSSLFCALLHQSEAHLFPFQGLAHSLRVYPGWHRVSGFVLANPERSNDRHSHFGTERGQVASEQENRTAFRAYSYITAAASISAMFFQSGRFEKGPAGR